MPDAAPPQPDAFDDAQRALAVDVSRSVIAQAPAGSGKTALLLDRYLRLLAIAEEPEEILVVTFTRKAAAEVRSRVLATIAAGDHPSIAAIGQRDEERHWGLRTSTHRLRIQTLDAFALSLARRVPILAGFSPRARFVEDAATFYRIAIDRVFAQLDTSPFAMELTRVLGLFDNDYTRVVDALVAMLERRDQWLDASRAAVESSVGERSSGFLSAAVRSLQSHVIADAMEAFAPDLDEIRAVAALAGIVSTEVRDAQYWQRIGALFTTQDGNLRRQIDARHGFPPALGREAKDRMLALLDRLRSRELDEVFFNLRLMPDDGAAGAASSEVGAVTLVLSLVALELAETFRATGSLDFTELTFAARRALGSADAPSELTLALDHRLRHLLVDEFQDTSVSQLDLLTRLLEGWSGADGRTFFAVGDPMQSIYRFRDAEVALMMRARREGVGALAPVTVRLTRNFRSAPALVAWTNRAFAAAFGAIDDPQLGRVAHVPSVPTRDARPDAAVSVTLIDADRNDRHEAALITQKIVELTTHRPDESIAVLVRSRTHLSALVPALDAAGVRWHGVDVEDPVSHPVTRDLLLLLEALQDPADDLRWLALLRAPFVGLDLADLLVVSGTSGHVSDGLASDAVLRRLSDDGRQRLARVAPILAAGIASRGQGVPAIRLEDSWRALGGPYAYPDDDTEARATAVFEEIEARSSRAVDATEVRAALTQRGDRVAVDGNAVQIMTIHRAKGLEFDHVLIPAIDRETRRSEPPLLVFRPEGNALLMATSRSKDRRLYDWLWREERHREAHERTRLLYVAATRARVSLHLFGCQARATPHPDGSSLLAPIWNAIADEVRWIPSAAAPESTVQRRGSLRLAADFATPAWTRESTPHQSVEPTRLVLSRRDDPSARMLRRELHALTRCRPLPDADAHVRAHRDRWRRLLALQTSAIELDTAVAFVADRLAAVLCDAHARSLLDGRELRTDMTVAVVDGEAQGLVDIDWVHVDETGTTWLVVLDVGDIATDAAELDRWLVRAAHAFGPEARAATYCVIDLSWREAIA